MTYAYRDLGKQPAGSTVLIRWRGPGADVLLLDPLNFHRYRQGGSPVFYSGGGRYGSSPARLSIPEDGRWFVVADFRGFSSSAQASVEVLVADAERSGVTDRESLIEAG